MYREIATSNRRTLYRHDTQQALDELEAILESDFLSYIPPSVVAGMKRVIARRRSRSALHD